MEFVFVVGGSYKAFYLNQVGRIKNPNIIVFNPNIFYDFDVDSEKDFKGPVSTELIYLNEVFNCPILVYNVRINKGIKDKCFILCIKGKIRMFERNSELYVRTKKGYILVCNTNCVSHKALITISMQDSFEQYKFNAKSNHYHFCCSSKSVTLIKGNKFYKKFNKCCKFILCFKKNMV